MTQAPAAEPLPAVTVPHPLAARWERDGAYLAAAVQLAFIDRPAWLRFAAPLWMAVAIALVFSPFGLLGAILGRGLAAVNVPTLLLCALLLVLAAANSYHAMLKANARRYAFVGDTARWEFTAEEACYRVCAPDGLLRHEARSRWSWFSAVTADPTGLRLHRKGSVEGYFIPVTAWVGEPLQVQQAVVACAQSAGLPVRRPPSGDWASVAGTVPALAMLLVVTMAVTAVVAAWPHVRRGYWLTLYASALDTFWWVGALLAVPVAALHLGLAWWWPQRPPGRELPAHAPHLVLALLWGTLLFAGMEALRTLIFDDALLQSRFATPAVAACAGIFVLLSAFVLHRCGVTPWVARRAALHNAGSTRLESP